MFTLPYMNLVPTPYQMVLSLVESVSGNTKSRPGLEDLPVELVQNIAWKLSRRDYNNMRLCNKHIARSLKSVNSIFDSLKEGCFGRLKTAYKDIAIDGMTKHFAEKLSPELQLILGSLRIMPPSGLSADMDLILYFKDELTGNTSLKNIKEAFCDGSENVIFRRDSFDKSYARFTLNTIHLTKDSLNSLFSQANKRFHECQDAEKLVIAAMVTALKNCLCQHLPAGQLLTDNDINALVPPFEILFSLGEKIFSMNFVVDLHKQYDQRDIQGHINNRLFERSIKRRMLKTLEVASKL